MLGEKMARRLHRAYSALIRWPDYLPPFWTAFMLTMALSLSQAFLALPIAVARVGLMTGIALVIVIGLINTLTMACMAEVCVRNGGIRYGRAFLGRLVTDYLGRKASILLTVTTVVRTFAVLLAGSIGLGITLGIFTHVHASVWAMLLFLIQFYVLARGSFNVPVNTMILILAVNLGLLLTIALLAFTYAQPANIWYANVPFHHDVPFDPSNLQLLFGVIIMLYIGHIFVLQCAKVVLPRDPSGHSLIWGSVAGTLCLTALLVIWMAAIGGAIAPEKLASQMGTAITPLAEHIGPSVSVMGSLLVLLLLGNSNLKLSNVLFNLVHERLPTQMRSTVTLPRYSGRLLLQPRKTSRHNTRLGLTYLGLIDGQPQFRLDLQLDADTHRLEITTPKHWDATALLDQLPALRPYDINLTLEILQAYPERVRLQVISPMRVMFEGGQRRTRLQALRLLRDHKGETSRLTGDLSSLAGIQLAVRRVQEAMLSEPGRFWIAISPVALAFLFAEWFLLTGTASFARVLSFAGIIGNSLTAGIFPVLLLIASRRKGDFIPGVIYRHLANPFITVPIYLLFLGNLFLHGLVIWQNPLERACALLFGGLVVVLTIVAVRRGVFTRRIVVQLRHDQGVGDCAVFSIVAGGQPAVAEVWLDYPNGRQSQQAASGDVPTFSALHQATFKLPVTSSKELKVWAHTITPEGNSEGFPALLEVQSGSGMQQFDLQRLRGQIVLPLTSPVLWVRIIRPKLST